MHFRLCQALKSALVEDLPSMGLSKRAQQVLAEMHAEHAWVDLERTAILPKNDAVHWWTFGGLLLNGALAERLREQGYRATTYDDLRVRVGGTVEVPDLSRLLRELASNETSAFSREVARRSVDTMKFIECVPRPLRNKLETERFNVREALLALAAAPILVVARG